MNLIPDIGYHPARVLIVDDDVHSRQLTEVMLAPEGLLLQTAASGEEALALIARDQPDLIILDVMMAGMDGYAVAAAIKADPATSNIMIIMVTALDDRSARIQGLSAGASEFLSKPVDRVELCLRVRNLLRLSAYIDYVDRYSRMLESTVASRTADLAERTKQAAVLAEQAAVLDLAQDAIIVRDMGGSISFWSHGATALYGWLSHEALGRPADALLRAELSDPAEKVDATLLRLGRWEGEAIHYTRDGARIVVASRMALQRDHGGTPVRVLAINSDITDRKATEAALERIRQDQMQFKDDFLSHVSHELRSPLTAIKQFTSILLSGFAGELNREQREYQNIVLKNISQLQSMIDDLLEVTRLETGKLTVEPEAVAIAGAVTDTFDTLAGAAHGKNIALSMDVPSDLPAAYADQIRLRQILINLLDNAIKFTPPGGTVTIRARLSATDSGRIVIDVADTGCGIGADVTDKIFERLFQQSSAGPTSRNGLGLGLYICKELVARHGGRIWATHRPKGGTTLSFTMPVFVTAGGHEPALLDGVASTASIAANGDIPTAPAHLTFSSPDGHDE